MTSIAENSFGIRRHYRLQYATDWQVTTCSQCDCTSYSYLIFACVLVVLGGLFTTFAYGVSHAFDSTRSFQQLWLVGPLVICSGIMVALKSLIYLRRKCLIHRLLRHTALLRELARQSRNNGASTSNNETDGSNSPHFDEQSSYQVTSVVCALPPSYDSLPGTPLVTIEDPGGGSIVEAPPPSYDEALELMSIGKIKCDESSKTEIMKQLSSRGNQD